MKIALDTNILIYATGMNGPSKQKAVFDILTKLPKSMVVLPVQVLGELFRVLMRKADYSASEARKEVQYWHATYSTVETSSEVVLAAIDLVVKHKLHIWDAVILAAAAYDDCRLLLSEDMQSGFNWGNITIVNPFIASPHALLRKALDE